jgi:hypothetical protein
MFPALEHFVTVHRLCGELTSDVGPLAPSGYRVQLTCACGASFERWVTPRDADADLLRSRLLAWPS